MGSFVTILDTGRPEFFTESARPDLNFSGFPTLPLELEALRTRLDSAFAKISKFNSTEFQTRENLKLIGEKTLTTYLELQEIDGNVKKSLKNNHTSNFQGKLTEIHDFSAIFSEFLSQSRAKLNPGERHRRSIGSSIDWTANWGNPFDINVLGSNEKPSIQDSSIEKESNKESNEEISQKAFVRRDSEISEFFEKIAKIAASLQSNEKVELTEAELLELNMKVFNVEKDIVKFKEKLSSLERIKKDDLKIYYKGNLYRVPAVGNV